MDWPVATPIVPAQQIYKYSMIKFYRLTDQHSETAQVQSDHAVTEHELLYCERDHCTLAPIHCLFNSFSYAAHMDFCNGIYIHSYDVYVGMIGQLQENEPCEPVHLLRNVSLILMVDKER